MSTERPDGRPSDDPLEVQVEDGDVQTFVVRLLRPAHAVGVDPVDRGLRGLVRRVADGTECRFTSHEELVRFLESPSE